MADERNKSSWWQTAPGLMTATAAVIAAVTGLIGGLNQVGLLDRVKAPPTATAPVPTPAPESGATRPDSTPAHEAARPAPTKSGPGAARAPAAGTPARRPARAPAPSPVPAPGANSTPATADSAPSVRPDSGARPDTSAPPPPPAGAPTGRLPKGTVMELAAASRVCSTTSAPGDEFTATVVVPVSGTGGAVVPVGAVVALEVVRLEAPSFIGALADSLSLNGRSYRLRSADAKVHEREFTAGAGRTGVGIGACIPAGGRITLTLGSPVVLGGR
jgi:hypothetical protein